MDHGNIALSCVFQGQALRPDREQVRMLRAAGRECQEIERLTGLLPEQIRRYCAQLGLPESGSCSLPAKREEELLRCRRCGALLVQPVRGRRRKYCSDACKNGWWNQRRREPDGKRGVKGENRNHAEI